MSKLPEHLVSIQLDSEGEITHRPWVGTFKAKLLLTHAERFAYERKYKEHLPSDIGVSEEDKFLAQTLAELKVRIVDSPAWWEGANYGEDLVDKKPIYDLILAINKEYSEWLKKVEALANEEKKA